MPRNQNPYPYPYPYPLSLKPKTIKNQKTADIPSSDIVIYINEPPLENWGIAGGKAADEVDLEFKVEV